VPASDAKINLLPRDPFEDSFLGKFLRWALSVGRYIVIATELVVILSFLARFKLDRDLADLNEAIAQKQAILASYRELEADYRAVAKRLELIAELDKQSLKANEAISKLAAATPLDVSFALIGLSPTEIELQGTAGSERGLTAFLRAVKVKAGFSGAILTQVSSAGEKGPGISFRLTAKTGGDK